MAADRRRPHAGGAANATIYREAQVMKNNSATPWLIVVALIAAAAGGWYWYYYRQPAPPPAPSPAAEAGPEVEHPIERVQAPAETGPAGPLPTLEASDEGAREALATLFGDRGVLDLLVTQHLIERLVATVDALPRQQLPPRLRPVESAPGAFLVGEDANGTWLDERNYARYAPFMQWAEGVDTAALAGAYVRWYPLCQQAYRELGYPKGHFNDRLVAVIDHLLAAPQVDPPVALVPWKGEYAFADPALQRLSVGHKLLIRIGPDNAARVKTKLRELRAALAGQSPVSEAAPEQSPEAEPEAAPEAQPEG